MTFETFTSTALRAHMCNFIHGVLTLADKSWQKRSRFLVCCGVFINLRFIKLEELNKRLLC